MLRYVSCCCVILALLLGLGGCKGEEQNVIVLDDAPRKAETYRQAEQPKIRIAIGGIITPQAGLAYYLDLLSYLQDKIERKIEYVDREDYAAINQLLKEGQLEAAFVCSGPYVEGKEEFGLELLVAPQANGKTVYYSYIIVHKGSSYKAFEDLRGKKFAFTDPLSNTGKLVPTYMLAQMGETPETFFKEFIFTTSHDKSIKAVSYGVVDGAAVDSLIWEYLRTTNPDLTSQTQILERSPAYAIPPIVVPSNLDKELKSRLKKALLDAHLDPRGKDILKRMNIDKFVVIDDNAYDSIRKMQDWLRKNQAKR
ncbi:substrate-binding domain-containing protein [Desulfogranum japonicum]|uniref:substrate-binding domain-containing protein n=1 Tax=Desulfogranum japonicum TaxID=231447 RepID=UPI0003FA0E99|nr:phosphate/phosphite/phosphonate ABC transporter substrate-binding protein [Desulfogranum japonicum]